MRSSLFRLNAFAISRRLAAFFLLFSLFGITARSQTQNATIFTSEKTVNSGQTLTLLNNGDSGVNGAYFTNYGTVQANGNFQVGTRDWAVFYQNGGTFNVNDYLSIARYGGSGHLDVNGGTVNSYNRQIIVGEVGNGSMTMNGGRAYSNQGVTLGANGGSAGTLSLNGGTLEAGAIWKGGGTGNLSFNGGTLKATRDESNFISGLNSANIGGNGAVIDNNGKEIGINQTLTGSGSGSVKFDGSGRTTLRQNNTYTGDTLVRGGVLQFYENGSLYNNGTAAGNIYVNSGATLYFNKQDVFGTATTGSSSPVTITLNGGSINNGGVFNNLANLTMNGGNLNASGGSDNGWNAYMLNNVTVGGSSASTITSNTSVNGNNNILLSRAGTTTFNVGSTGDATGDLRVSAKLTDGNGVVGSLTKTGVGKMVLSTANTYTGETKVLAGTLVVDTGGSIVSSSATVSSGATLTVESGGVVKITTASTTSTEAWNTEGTINFEPGSIIDVTGLTLSQQPYVLISGSSGSSVTGTPILQGATGFTVSNTDNMILLTPYTYTIADEKVTITGYTGTGGNVVIPSEIGRFRVTAIGNDAFKNKTLTVVTIPEGVTTIGNKAFFESTVEEVFIPIGVTTIGVEAFAGCREMELISLPSSLATIGERAFQSCEKLKNVIIPEGVTSLGKSAFQSCTILDSVTLPTSLTHIKQGTFASCPKLTTISIPSAVDQIDINAFYGSKVAVVNFEGPYPPRLVDLLAFNSINDPAGAIGYYPATASANWSRVSYYGITLRSNDQTAPVITLIGANPLQIYKGATFSDPGATATDNVDATTTITVSGAVNTETVGNYTRTYNATDAAGNLALPVTRTVSVVLDPSRDEDGDEVSNGAETLAGTNPNDSASAPNLPIAVADAFTAKLVAGMTTKVTTASLISNDKYSGIPGETRGVTFVSAQPTSRGGAAIRVKGGWLIYQPSSLAVSESTDTFTYTVSNGVKTATGTVRVSLASSGAVQVAIDRVDGNKVYFSVMPGMTFEVQGANQPGASATWTTIVGPNNGNWTSGADGRLIVADPAAVGGASRFYQFRWIPIP